MRHILSPKLLKVSYIFFVALSNPKNEFEGYPQYFLQLQEADNQVILVEMSCETTTKKERKQQLLSIWYVMSVCRCLKREWFISVGIALGASQ